MARINIAMLSQTEQESVQSNGDELLVDGNVVEVQKASGEIEIMDGVVDETRAAADAVDGLAEKIQAQETVSEDAIQIAQEMMAYFSKRTGVKFQGVSAAMESYSAGNTVKKEQIVKELKLASESYKKQIAIAQEGIIDRIKHKFSLIFSNSDKLEKELKEVSLAYDENGVKTQVIEDAAFARLFTVKGKDVVDGADAVAFAAKIEKSVHNPKIVKTINDLSKVMDRLTLSITKGNIFSDSQGIQEIRELQREVLELSAAVQNDFDFKLQKAKVDIMPLERDDKAKLVPIILSLLDTEEFEKAERQLTRAVDGYYNAYFNAIQNRLFGEYSKDARDAEMASDIAEEVYAKLSWFVMDGFEVAHACVKYIKASTQK